MKLTSLRLVLPLAALATLVSRPAHAQSSPSPRSKTVEVFAGLGQLSSTESSGASAQGGVRVGLGRFVAASADTGWGLLMSPTVQDRWWLIPSLVGVIPAGAARIDVGAGAGLGVASGYSSLGSFAQAPFETSVWAFQLVPAARVYAAATDAQVQAKAMGAFLRADAGTLLLGAHSFGFRSGNPNPSVADTTWFTLWMGVHYRAL
jgi:hypothetical protein